MNSTNLTNLNENSNNNNSYIDYKGFLLIVALPLKIFGSVTNMINAIIFKNKIFKDKVFSYIFIHSVAEFFYLFLLIFIQGVQCGNYCDVSIQNSLISKLMEVYIDYYITSCLAIFCLLIDVTVCMERVLVVLNTNRCILIKDGSPKMILSVYCVISMIYYLPVLFSFRVRRIVNDELYEIKQIIGKNTYNYYLYVVNAIRGPIFTLILTIFNIIIIVNFRKQMKKKEMIKSKSSKYNYFF
jgi:hypothetical protein